MKKTEGGKTMTLRKRNALWGYGFISLWLIGFFALTLYPAVYSVIISLNDVRLTNNGMVLTWRGMYHYNYALNVGTEFKMQVGNAVTFILCVTVVVVVFSLVIALMLNQKFPLRTFFRVVYFLPVIIMSGPVISKLLSANSVNFSAAVPAVRSFLSDLPGILRTPTEFVLQNLAIILWFCGVQILVFLAGLQKISPDIYEAAVIDGAGAWEKFWKITLPFMKPIALLCAVFTVVETSNYSGLAINNVISAQMFNQTRLYSYSAAMSWLYFIVVALILAGVYLVFRLFGRKSEV